MELQSQVLQPSALTDCIRQSMYALMDTFYDGMKCSVFIRDLEEKDHVILLLSEDEKVKGFSTLQEVHFHADGREVRGIFSGDTIIHKEHWGSLELFKAFARLAFARGREYKEYYWFLISKGYKTYRMLPVFFHTFYPNYKGGTPPGEKAIMDAFGAWKFPSAYDQEKGVIQYRGSKDRLKAGVADITEKQLRDKNIAFFLAKNPGHSMGDDLMCLALLKEDNLRRSARTLLLGSEGHAQ